ncbi:MAG TPA: M20/M25/M40 family metallo-hydrolase, partial [Thermoanaerobaculia bacterium]
MKPLAFVLLVAATAAGQSIDSMIDRELPSLIETYKTLHTSPELSMQEEKTSATVAARLRALGYTVADHVGDYQQPGKTCYGVVAMMKNGDGPVVLVRTDMDALPVQEQTGMPYASRVANVMHACGHDIHMATLIGTATMLAQLKNRWHGTVMLIGQPAEEVVQGASAMLRDGLYERFARPTYAIALHDNSSLP